MDAAAHRPDTVDVLVVGAGLAGAACAIEAARAGARTMIVGAGDGLSGSSFYPGTWGLGLIGPEDAADARDLARTICHVGGGVADPELVQALVEGIAPAMAWIESLGVRLKCPTGAATAREAAYIPCFDHKNRIWRGLEREPVGTALSRELARLGVRFERRLELVDLLRGSDGTPWDLSGDMLRSSAGRDIRPVTGGVLFDHASGRLRAIPCRALVIATGGAAGVYPLRLTAGDVLSSATGIAVSHGCRTVNLEFIQLMPGLVSPKRGIVFNEKSFRFAVTIPALPRDLLEMRAAYGPFTSRLPSRAVDLAIAAAGSEGLALSYRFPQEGVPELVRDFCRWLELEHGIGPDRELWIAHYAHASNGGIAIDANGATSLPGLFACGEATGGMHGADRVGGLSSANCLVFGRRAGSAAARYAQGSFQSPCAAEDDRILERARIRLDRHMGEPTDRVTILEATRRLRNAMGAHAMVLRSAEGLEAALRDVSDLIERSVHPASHSAHDSWSDPSPAADAARARSARLLGQLALAHTMLEAMLARTESLGSHYRVDAATGTLSDRTSPNMTR